jgi:DNA-binding transcriptional ArsR family regulator
MAMQDKPEVREVMVVDDPDTMKLLLSGKCNDILELIQSRAISVSEIAKILKINPGSAHYHLKELERHGLARMVGEETKGNVVKKYYRAAARNFYLNGSRFKVLRPGEADPMDEFHDRLIGMMSPFGYDIPPEKAGPLKDAMVRYDKRKKELLGQIQDIGIEKMESDRLLIGDAYYVALLLKEIEDEEMGKIRDELRAILSDIRGIR